MDYQEYGSKYYKSQLYDLYKEIQNEIKDKVISKLLLKVQNMYKELTELKAENTIYHIYLKEYCFIKMNTILLIIIIIKVIFLQIQLILKNQL